MVKVTGSSGKIVDVQMLGIAEVMRRLKLAKQKIQQGADFGVVRAGGYVEEEVKESIIGNRAEPKSVDSGLFGNSIEFKRTGVGAGIVEPKSKRYPKSNKTTQDIALYMEKGTSKIIGRRHFANTKARTEDNVRDIIEKEIKKQNL